MSEELALKVSATEIEDELRQQALDRISQVVIAKREAEYQQRIDDHYTARAKKLMESIWVDCLRRTGHSVDEARDVETRAYVMMCVTCMAPMHKSNNVWVIDPVRAQEGFRKLGQKLREADRAAEIEWIPGT